jgi:hypothetical protein
MKNKLTGWIKIASFIFLLAFPGIAISQNTIVSIEEGFKNQPEEAKPRSWWHWTNSNVTKEGITKGLEWMNQVY